MEGEEKVENFNVTNNNSTVVEESVMDLTKEPDGEITEPKDSHKDLNTDSSQENQLSEPVKRGRGRPRKSDTPKKLNEVQSSDIECRTDFMLVTPSLKRGRGRPPNTFKPKPPKSEIKNPVGRPRINPPKMPSDRGPGRPRIHPMKISSGRGPGRPRVHPPKGDLKRFSRPMNMTKQLQVRLVKCTVREGKKRGRPPGSKNKKKLGRPYKDNFKDIKKPKWITQSSSNNQMSYSDFVRQVNEELSAINGTCVEDDSTEMDESTGEDEVDWKDDSHDDMGTTDNEIDSEKTPKKRRPGRPPGAKNRTPEERERIKLIKKIRGRGRPKKDQRGPGRPPKLFQTMIRESPTGKKRGRPPKNPSQVKSDTVSSANESRGRLCKGDVSYMESVDDVIEVISDSESMDRSDEENIKEVVPVKRGRGRPPSPTKRKGRPPLSETKKIKKSESPESPKRGRPKKGTILGMGQRRKSKIDYAAMAEGLDIEDSLEEDEEEDSSDGETRIKVSIVSNTKSGQKRGRGRPPKNSKVRKSLDDSMESELEHFTVVKEKRGPGRPKKLCPKSDFSSGTEDSQDESFVSNDKDFTETVVKRPVGRPRIQEKVKKKGRPGRPKKNTMAKELLQQHNNQTLKLTSDDESSQNDSITSGNEKTSCSETKRGRGRPKKLHVDVSIVISSSGEDSPKKQSTDEVKKKKRGPGRPRKTPVSLDMTCDEEELDDVTGISGITMEGWEGFSGNEKKKTSNVTKPVEVASKNNGLSEDKAIVISEKSETVLEDTNGKDSVHVSRIIDDCVVKQTQIEPDKSRSVEENITKAEKTSLENMTVPKSEKSSLENTTEPKPERVHQDITNPVIIPEVTFLASPVVNTLAHSSPVPSVSVISTSATLNSNVQYFSTNSTPNIIVTPNLLSTAVNTTPVLLTNSNMTLPLINTMPNIVTVSSLPQTSVNAVQNTATGINTPSQPIIITDSNMPTSFVQNEVGVVGTAIISSAKNVVTETIVPHTKVITETVPQNSEPGKVSSLFLDASMS